jgi:hypothetical protein
VSQIETDTRAAGGACFVERLGIDTGGRDGAKRLLEVIRRLDHARRPAEPAKPKQTPLRDSPMTRKGDRR